MRKRKVQDKVNSGTQTEKKKNWKTDPNPITCRPNSEEP